MRYSIGAGPLRVYGGHASKPRSMKATPITFAVWLVICIAGIVWLGVSSQSASVVIGAIIAVIIVSFKIMSNSAKN